MIYPRYTVCLWYLILVFISEPYYGSTLVLFVLRINRNCYKRSRRFFYSLHTFETSVTVAGKWQNNCSVSIVQWESGKHTFRYLRLSVLAEIYAKTLLWVPILVDKHVLLTYILVFEWNHFFFLVLDLKCFLRFGLYQLKILKYLCRRFYKMYCHQDLYTPI